MNVTLARQLQLPHSVQLCKWRNPLGKRISFRPLDGGGLRRRMHIHTEDYGKVLAAGAGEQPKTWWHSY